ncbi:MAG TPA: nickel-responsive transcriptional regulator NikR [Thermoplasmatales archaeon]|nr:nickel-responsive transcriptional regulator NikR [Thermoplasmatales archaeon]
MPSVVRFGVSLEPELLRRFDKIIRKRGYSNRSEAIRDLIRKALVEEEISQPEKKIVGVLSIVYDHDFSDITHKLLHIQHSQHSKVRSTMHIHLDEKNCLEVLVVEGKTSEIKSFADRIQSLKGVKYSKMSLFVPP